MVIIILPVGLFVYGELSAQNLYDIKVSDDTKGFDQIQPKVAVGYSGEIAVVWADKRNGFSAIYYQYFDSAGNAFGINKKIGGETLTAPQFEPSLNANLLGQFGSVWKDFRNGSYPFNPDIYFASMDTTGVGLNHAVTAARFDSTCESPDIAVLPNGSKIIVWADYRNGNWDIYGQRLSSSGGMLGDNFRINSDDGLNQQHSPRVAGLANGGFVVVWYDNRYGNDDIFGRRFEGSAVPTGNDFRINDDSSDKRQAWPAIGSDGNGRFFVAWVDWRNGNYPDNPDIYYRRYNSAGVPLGISRNASFNDDNATSQRDVSICVDRMGNIGIVWADSSTGQWNSIGRVIDSEGKVDSTYFQMHQYTDGRQRQPDIATDGYKYYFVWADDRGGDFDIYLTIKSYNDPTIYATPNALHFTMDESGGLPEAQNVTLENAGYGELNWELRSNVDWIDVSPAAGMTPENISVSVTGSDFAYGDYAGEIRVINLGVNDSSVVIPVSLSVTAPILEVSPDTVHYRVLAEMGNPDPSMITVNNSGSGTLNWGASESSNWFDLDPVSGVAPEYADVNVNISGMLYGDYIEPIEFYSDEAVNGYDTVWVSISLVGNMPYLSPSPSPLILESSVGNNISESVTISNLGSGSLNWEVINNTPWMSVFPTGGTDNDAVTVETDVSGLASGSYLGELLFYDSASFNLDTLVPIYLYLSSYDTLEIYNANTMLGGPGVMPIRLSLYNSAKGFYCPLTYESADATLDSIVWNEGVFDDRVNLHTNIYDSTAEIGIYVDQAYLPDYSIPAGEYEIAQLFFTGGLNDAVCYIDTLGTDSGSLYILGDNDQVRVPELIFGRLFVGNPTDVSGHDGNGNLPGRFYLSQNYPNPFNSSTSLDLSLSEGGEAEISVYNILGQKIAVLIDQYLEAGDYRIEWNGKLKGKAEAPSGIYFAHIQIDGDSSTRKMLLLK